MKHVHSVLELAQLCALLVTIACSRVAEAPSLLLLLRRRSCAAVLLLHFIFCSSLHGAVPLQMVCSLYIVSSSFFGGEARCSLLWQPL